MHRWTGTLVPGTKPPYTTWVFLEVPDDVVMAWGGRGPYAVRGTLAGAPFRGTVSRGDGAFRMPVPRALRDEAGLSLLEPIEVRIEPDPEPRPVDVPDELQVVLDADPEVAAAFDALPPSHRRAWAAHVAGGKRPETRVRRAEQAPAGIRGRTFPRG